MSDDVVMGLDAWVMSPKLSGQQQHFLLGVAQRAAEQKLELAKLAGCWQKVQPGKTRLVLGGGGEHYGVECLRQAGTGTVGKGPGWGLRVYFDQ